MAHLLDTRRIPARRVSVGRWIFILVVAVVAGMAIILEVRGWSVLNSESGGACGGNNGVYGPCPRGATPVLLLGFAGLFVSLPIIGHTIFRRPKADLIFVAAGLAGGVFIGQPIFTALHGTDLSVAWTASYDSSGSLTTEGVWINGGSLVRVRLDQITSYQSATGQQQWTVSVPGLDIACAVSGQTSEQVGLIGYGSNRGACNHILAVDLSSGRVLWAKKVPVPFTGDQGNSLVAADGDVAVLASPDGVRAYNLLTGALKWTSRAPNGCYVEELQAARSILAVSPCSTKFYVTDLNPASGARLWQTPVTEPSSNYQFEILSADPAVVTDRITGPRQDEHVRIFSAAGHLDASIPVGAINTADGPVSLDTTYYQGFGPEVVTADGLLIGVTQSSGGHSDIVAYRLSDGQRQWLVPMPDNVETVRQDGSELLVLDQSQPTPALDEISIRTGSLHSIGFIPQSIFDFSDSSLYPVGDRYLIVNLKGTDPIPPVAAVSG